MYYRFPLQFPLYYSIVKSDNYLTFTDETGYSLHSKDGPEMSNFISNQGPPNPSKPVGIFAFKNLQKITFDMKVSEYLLFF